MQRLIVNPACEMTIVASAPAAAHYKNMHALGVMWARLRRNCVSVQDTHSRASSIALVILSVHSSLTCFSPAPCPHAGSCFYLLISVFLSFDSFLTRVSNPCSSSSVRAPNLFSYSTLISKMEQANCETKLPGISCIN